MKRIIALLFVMALAIPMYAQVANGSLPKGVMTYNSWSGKISVGGETIPKELLPHYFDEADMKEFKASQGMYVGALVSAVTAGVCLGVGLAFMVPVWQGMTDEGKGPGIGCLVAGGVGVAAAFILDGVASHKRNVVIGKYNANLAYQPQLHFGDTPNGLGLALLF